MECRALRSIYFARAARAREFRNRTHCAVVRSCYTSPAYRAAAANTSHTDPSAPSCLCFLASCRLCSFAFQPIRSAPMSSPTTTGAVLRLMSDLRAIRVDPPQARPHRRVSSPRSPCRRAAARRRTARRTCLCGQPQYLQVHARAASRCSKLWGLSDSPCPLPQGPDETPWEVCACALRAAGWVDRGHSSFRSDGLTFPTREASSRFASHSPRRIRTSRHECAS